jgi:hypothetical protein
LASAVTCLGSVDSTHPEAATLRHSASAATEPRSRTFNSEAHPKIERGRSWPNMIEWITGINYFVKMEMR